MKFDFDVGRDMQFAIKSTLSEASFAVEIPSKHIESTKIAVVRDIVNPVMEINFLVNDLYPLVQAIAASTTAYLAIEVNGKLTGFSKNLSASNPYTVVATDPSNHYGESATANHLYLFHVDDYGYPIKFWQPGGAFGNTTYDPRQRPWYIPVKANPVKQWSPIYIDATTGEPCLTIVQPLFNDTVHGSHSFIGTMALDMFFLDINNYLVNEYGATDRIVFIVDKSSLVLVGNSLGQKSYSVDANGNKVRLPMHNSCSFLAIFDFYMIGCLYIMLFVGNISIY